MLEQKLWQFADVLIPGGICAHQRRLPFLLPALLQQRLDVFCHLRLNGLEVRVTEVAEGVNRENIVAGLHSAIAKRTMSMVNRLGLVPPVAMAGGVAKNKGVVKAIEEEIGAALIVPSEPQIVGALGAALLAMEDLGATTR